MRRLVEHAGTGFRLQAVKDLLLFLFICRQKAFKTETSGRQSRHGQGSDTGAGTRKRRYFDTFIQAHPDQFFSGIRDTRRTGICHEGDVFSLLHLTDQIFGLIILIIFMVTCHRHMDIKMIEQFDAAPGILRRDQVCIFKCFQHAEGDIFQITDRCGT